MRRNWERIRAMVPILLVAALVVLVAASIGALVKVRWKRKEHLGHWKEWDE
jgi:hypothetical protein